MIILIEEYSYMMAQGEIKRNTISDSGATCIMTPREDLMVSIIYKDEVVSLANGR